jgi:hypothetical protein
MTADDLEEWRTLREYPLYEFGSLGHVRSIREGGRWKRHLMNPTTGRRGYKQVSLRNIDGVTKTQALHKLIALAFLGPADDRECDHIDRDRTNNRVSNLRYCSRAENGRNRSGRGNTRYEYIDELPRDAVRVNSYNGHSLSNVHYCDRNFYVFNGVHYGKLVPVETSVYGYLYVNVVDDDGRKTHIYLHIYREIINDI